MWFIIEVFMLVFGSISSRVANLYSKSNKFREIELYPKPMQKHIPIYV